MGPSQREWATGSVTWKVYFNPWLISSLSAFWSPRDGQLSFAVPFCHSPILLWSQQTVY